MVIKNDGFDSYGEFEQLYRIHFQMLYGCAYRIVRDTENAREIVQEVFIEIWNRQDRWKHIKSFKAYLLTTTYRQSLDFLNKKKRFISIEYNHHPQENIVENDFNAKEFTLHMIKAIDDLPEKCKQIFLLSREEDQSYMQIADSLGISIKTVEAQIGIALKRLRKSLFEYQKSPSKKIFLLF